MSSSVYSHLPVVALREFQALIAVKKDYKCMAEKILKKVKEELNCSICLDTYVDPKLLQCLHTYCRKCLVKLVARDKQGQLFLTCPICRHDTPVPANGVVGLQPAFHINHFLEIMEEHKNPPASAEKAERDSASLTFRDKVKVCCREHAGKEVELFCETCGEPICLKCDVVGAKHHNHNSEELDKAYERYKVEVTASLEPMEKQVTTITQALAQLYARCAEISDQRAAVEADVHTAFEGLQRILDTRKTELISQLHQITQRKLKELEVQKDQLETTLAQLSSCLGFMKESLKTGSQEEVLLMKSSVVMQVKELTTTFPPDMLKPSTEADVIFSALADVTTACRNYGRVLTHDVLPDPSKCHATGKGIEAAVVGEMSTAVLQVVSFNDKPCVEPILSSECELVSELTGTRTRGSVERSGQSQYEISYQPTIKGRHQVHVKVENQHIRGSPFTVSAKSPVEKLGTSFLAIQRVCEPWGVAVNQRGEVIVAEFERHRISVFCSSGEKLRTFGTYGFRHGQFEYPRGVAVDDKGNVLVADSENHRIQKFTPEGKFLAAVGAKGHGPLQFDFPTDIAFNAANKKVYVTDNSCCIQVLDSDLTFSGSFGKSGCGKGQFDHPRGIACDSTGKVYIGDRNNNHIQVFTAEGKFLKTLGRQGDGRGELKRPNGVAIDSNDMVYVTEADNHRVSVFTSEGDFVKSFGSRGKRAGQFRSPYGVAVDGNGVVYVCDSYNNRVQVF